MCSITYGGMPAAESLRNPGVEDQPTLSLSCVNCEFSCISLNSKISS
jgi:hypothetical protein